MYTLMLTILSKWMLSSIRKYLLKLNYSVRNDWNTTTPQPASDDHYSILREEFENAVRAPKKRKSAGFDNVPAEIKKDTGDNTVEVLTTICNEI